MYGFLRRWPDRAWVSILIHIGVDPGLKGAIAFIRPGAYGAIPIPLLPSGPKAKGRYDLVEIRAWFVLRQAEHSDVFVTVEQSGPIPPRVRAGTLAQYGRGAQEGWLWLLTALRISHQAVRPQSWQKIMHAGTGGQDTKQKSILAAQRLFPDACLRRTARSRVDDDGMAEALLLAEYGRRTATTKEPN